MRIMSPGFPFLFNLLLILCSTHISWQLWLDPRRVQVSMSIFYKKYVVLCNMKSFLSSFSIPTSLNIWSNCLMKLVVILYQSNQSFPVRHLNVFFCLSSFLLSFSSVHFLVLFSLGSLQLSSQVKVNNCKCKDSVLTVCQILMHLHIAMSPIF